MDLPVDVSCRCPRRSWLLHLLEIWRNPCRLRHSDFIFTEHARHLEQFDRSLYTWSFAAADAAGKDLFWENACSIIIMQRPGCGRLIAEDGYLIPRRSDQTGGGWLLPPQSDLPQPPVLYKLLGFRPIIAATIVWWRADDTVARWAETVACDMSCGDRRSATNR